MERGKLFYASRPFVRLITGRWTAQVEVPKSPTVFVCSHSNMRGPLVTQCWLPFPTRLWVFHMFLEKETFRSTISALQAGDSVLVFPDVDYTDSTDGIGAVYDGFLLIDRFWSRVSREPLDFVPLRLDTAARRITAGKAVRFDRSADRKSEMVRVREALREEINRT